MRGRETRAQKGDAVAATAFLAPFLLLLLLFQYVPIAMLASDSLSSFSLFDPSARTLVGFDNYRRIAVDPATRQSFLVTFLFAAGLVALVLPTSLFLALFLDSRLPARHLVRTLVLIPTITSSVVVATMWTFIFQPANGLLNSLLALLRIGPLDFLTSPYQALPSLILMTLWQQVGFAAVIYLAALQGIPAEIVEAARLDGASPVRRLLHVVLPLLGRTTSFVVVMMTVFSLQAFAPAYLMTSGGPRGTTNFIVHHIYVTAFSLQSPGFASAICVVMILLAMAISLAQGRLLRSRWRY